MPDPTPEDLVRQNEEKLVPIKLTLPWGVIQALKREAVERSQPGDEVTASDIVLEALLTRSRLIDRTKPQPQRKETKK